MKAIISNRIYLDNPGELVTKEIKRKLTYKFVKKGGTKKSNFAAVETVLNYKSLPNGILSIPQCRTDLIPANYEIIDRRISYEMPYPEPVHKLFDEQVEVYNEINDTAIINAKVGWGKSYTALWLAKKLAQKTLVVTHTVTLRDQWIGDIAELFKREPGIIGSGKIDFEDHFIVVANTQTLVKHVEKVKKEFGLVILDECHHVPATSFSGILDAMHARYRLGLSGTLIRKDGKQIMFPDYFGNHVVKPPQSNTVDPIIKLVRTNVGLMPDMTWAEKISKLVQDPDYQNFVAALAKGYMQKGYKVLVIADRVEFLKTIAKLSGPKMGLVTGQIGDRDLVKQQIMNGELDGICGSRQIFSEGTNIPPLSCVILTIPINNDSLLTQIIGRVQRLYPGKLQPVVLDLQFTGWADKKQNEARLGVYLREGWEIITV